MSQALVVSGADVAIVDLNSKLKTDHTTGEEPFANMCHLRG